MSPYKAVMVPLDIAYLSQNSPNIHFPLWEINRALKRTRPDLFPQQERSSDYHKTFSPVTYEKMHTRSSTKNSNKAAPRTTSTTSTTTENAINFVTFDQVKEYIIKRLGPDSIQSELDWEEEKMINAHAAQYIISRLRALGEDSDHADLYEKKDLDDHMVFISNHFTEQQESFPQTDKALIACIDGLMESSMESLRRDHTITVANHTNPRKRRRMPAHLKLEEVVVSDSDDEITAVEHQPSSSGQSSVTMDRITNHDSSVEELSRTNSDESCESEDQDPEAVLLRHLEKEEIVFIPTECLLTSAKV